MRFYIILLVIFVGYIFCADRPGTSGYGNSNIRPSYSSQVGSRTSGGARPKDGSSNFVRMNSEPGIRQHTDINPNIDRPKSLQPTKNIVIFDTNACITAYKFIREFKDIDDTITYRQLFELLNDAKIDDLSISM